MKSEDGIATIDLSRLLGVYDNPIDWTNAVDEWQDMHTWLSANNIWHRNHFNPVARTIIPSHVFMKEADAIAFRLRFG